jgi:ParB family chromosome partitioning protein
MSGPILTATVGKNDVVFGDVLALYVPDGADILDMTYGHGNFWRLIDRSKYSLVTNDWLVPADYAQDFRNMNLEDASFDCIVLDPPYMHGGATVKDSINKVYRNQNTSHESVIRLYAGGMLEAARMLRKSGRFILKCQDEIESAQQRLSHVELIQLGELLGFKLLDLFVVVQPSTPAMRESYQKTARKNHSYFLVMEYRR